MSMARVTPEALAALQQRTERIRNICILAHVDHGKTTLSDSLVSANGIISDKLAGKIRFLDNTEEEQVRGITMKSSAISLLFQDESATATSAEPFLINLVDSPGHVDFSFDVSTAVRLCDGALVLVDAVEGVCAQTIAVIRQAWQEGIRPCLVINKMDRLILELQLSPAEAYQRLNRILEQANAVLSALIRTHVLAKHDGDEEDDGGEEKKEEEQREDATALKQEEQDDEKAVDNDADYEAITNETAAMEDALLFSPVRGNVLFASAFDGWAFSLGGFAQLFAGKLGLPSRTVRLALWGEHYYHAKQQKIVRRPPTSASQTMFCAFVLEPIWTAYATLNEPFQELAPLRALTRQLRVAKKVSDRELKATDRRLAVQAVMRRWLPLAPSVLKMVTRALPHPVAAQKQRAHHLCGVADLHDNVSRSSRAITTSVHSAENSLTEAMRVFHAIERCETEPETPVVVFICKMLSVEANVLSDFVQLGLERDQEVYVAMARVYSGVLTRGQSMYVMDPKFQGGLDLENTTGSGSERLPEHVTRLEPGHLRPYMMMGRDLHALDQVPAGNIVALCGLQEHVLKTATLASSLRCPSLTRMPYQAKPIVRVAVEPEDPRHFAALEAGLQRLYRSDPTVEVQVQETGEHVVIALGELHLERCIKDLRERFAKVAVRVSAPIVGFRETVVDGPLPSPQQAVVFRDLLASAAGIEEEGVEGESLEQATSLLTTDPTMVNSSTPDGSLTLQVRAMPLPAGVAAFLEEHVEELRQHLLAEAETDHAPVADAEDSSLLTEVKKTESEVAPPPSFVNRLEALLRASDDVFWQTLPLDRVWTFGPRRVGPNLLINNIAGFSATTGVLARPVRLDPTTTAGSFAVLRRLENAILTGFQMTTAAGPLCDEPMYNVAFVLENVIFHASKLAESDADGEDGGGQVVSEESAATEASATSLARFGPLSGQVISTMRTACRAAFVKRPVRLVEAVYACTVQCQAEQLGRLYSVLAKRRGDVVYEELSDGSSLFTVRAHVPVVESFGLATELLIQTSGAASNPQLVFSHWVVLAMDPFFQPQTEEEREDFGERVYEHNVVRKYIEAVRKRKGLARAEKIVVHAEKQRTLARKR